jgi:AcrR family transcriptional regulator
MATLRSDAAARRDLILDAADEVFSESGVTASLDLVVERAGVGRATLYRNFPSRGALMEALLSRYLLSLEDAAKVNQDRDDALFLLFERMAVNIADSVSLVDFWRTVERDSPVVGAARKRIIQVFSAPLQRAIAAGLCRPDLASSDILLVSGMLGAALRGKSPADRRALARRALDLLRGGLAIPPASRKR